MAKGKDVQVTAILVLECRYCSKKCYLKCYSIGYRTSFPDILLNRTVAMRLIDYNYALIVTSIPFTKR
uniref:Ribosomal protein L33 n=1 Tax=Diodia virginiana TaxID=298690 RepID=A0A6G9IUC7_9GENT|nr:ribosomal protein L33 [Diodia virginiana]